MNLPFHIFNRVGLLRALVRDRSFAIVSNNCWGAHIYQALDLPYQTPFIGLFILPDSYLRLLRNFESTMASELAFVSVSSDLQINSWRQRLGLTYPIGVLGSDVEVHFQHYANAAEAQSKWCRRVERIPADPARRFFKFDDRDGARPEQIIEFCGLPLQHKVCFTARPYRVNTVLADSEPGASHVVDGLSLGKTSRRNFNALRWISTLPRHTPLPSIL